MSETLTSDDIAVVLVNFRTPDLLETAASSFRKFYPEIEMVLVDNGSGDQSLDVINSLVKVDPSKTKRILLERNFYHGPAMDTVMHSITKDLVFFLDTDTETYRGGFIEEMLREMNGDENVYGVGRTDRVNKRGFATEDGSEMILISAYMMLRRNTYMKLPPFVHHGMPTLQNFAAATKRGFGLRHLDMDSYIHHAGRGTAGRFGYGLGLRGKMEYILNKVGL